MGLVTRMKKFHHVEVSNAMSMCGYSWRKPQRRPHNIERMVMGLPRPALERLVYILENSKHPRLPKPFKDWSLR